MKTNFLPCLMLVIVGFLICLSRAQAFDPGAAAGDWRILSFTVPSQLTLERNGVGVVTNIPEAGIFEVSTGSITVLSNGTFSGNAPDPLSGTISADGQGQVILNIIDNGDTNSIPFHLNVTSDVLAAGGNFSSDTQDLILGLRSPATLTTNDLAGLWNATALGTPYQLVLNRDSSNRVTGIEGLGSFETYGGTLTINANGAIDGNIDGAFTGVVTSASSGVVNITVTDEEGSFPVSLFVNASKDVMAFVEGDFNVEDNFQQIMIFQKAAAANPVGELAAHWRVMVYDFPELTPQFNGQGQLIGLGGNDNFSTERGHLVSGYDGFLTAQVDGPGTGLFSSATNGLLTLNITSDDPETIGFQLNAGETVLGSSRYIGDGWEMAILTKSAPVSGPAQDFGLLMLPATNALTFAWAAATNSVLQSSGDLTNWNTLSATIGQHSYSTSPSNSAAFYRVVQPVP